MRLTHLILCLLVAISPIGADLAAQANQKNPKVAEVESYLTQKTIDYIKGRFPSMPILVSITVDPLRRNESPIPAVSEIEILPFYAIQETQRLDEWDEPSKTEHD